jgi:hypothetical protein
MFSLISEEDSHARREHNRCACQWLIVCLWGGRCANVGTANTAYTKVRRHCFGCGVGVGGAVEQSTGSEQTANRTVYTTIAQGMGCGSVSRGWFCALLGAGGGWAVEHKMNLVRSLKWRRQPRALCASGERPGSSSVL